MRNFVSLHCVMFVHMFKLCPCECKSVRLCAFVHVTVMLYLSPYCVLCGMHVCMQACLHVVVSNLCIP